MQQKNEICITKSRLNSGLIIYFKGLHSYINSRNVKFELIENPNQANTKDQIVDLKNYLEKYNSPLLGNENYIVSRSDEVGLDFRLITAIAQQESNLCKIFPEETYNCWGWGIHSKGTLGFASYNEAIDAVTYGLKTEYIDKGLTTPDTIWKKYTPSSPDGAWAKGVNQFMSEME